MLNFLNFSNGRQTVGDGAFTFDNEPSVLAVCHLQGTDDMYYYSTTFSGGPGVCWHCPSSNLLFLTTLNLQWRFWRPQSKMPSRSRVVGLCDRQSGVFPILFPSDWFILFALFFTRFYQFDCLQFSSHNSKSHTTQGLLHVIHSPFNPWQWQWLSQGQWFDPREGCPWFSHDGIPSSRHISFPPCQECFHLCP